MTSQPESAFDRTAAAFPRRLPSGDQAGNARRHPDFRDSAVKRSYVQSRVASVSHEVPYRSITSIPPRAREQHGKNRSRLARSSVLRNRSRWSGSPSSTRSMHETHTPWPHEDWTGTPAAMLRPRGCKKIPVVVVPTVAGQDLQEPPVSQVYGPGVRPSRAATADIRLWTPRTGPGGRARSVRIP